MTDQSMIERVARAIAASYLQGTFGQNGPSAELLWRDYIPEARAAIEAMREPTPEMLGAGAATTFGGASDPAFEDLAESCARDAYTAMIDAALKEEPK